VTYQNSRVLRHTMLPQGTLKRLSLSILVDHTVRWDNKKRLVEPPSPEKLKVIHDLVAAATGLNTDRGDQLVVQAFPFEATLTPETMTSPSAGEPSQPPSNLPAWLKKLMEQKNFPIIAGIGGAALLALVVGLAVALRRKSKKNAIGVEAAALLEKGSPRALGPTPQDVENEIQERIAEQSAEKARQEADTLMKLKLPAVSTKKTEVLTKHIAAEAKKDSVALAQVVRSWLHGQR
jgi:flagellar M-ring protein FliF